MASILSKILGRYLTTRPVLTNDTTSEITMDALGSAYVAAGDAPQAEDNSNGVIAIAQKLMSWSTAYNPTLYTNLGAATKANIKATPGIVVSIYGFNANNAVRYLQLHNKATAPAGTDVPLYSFLVYGNGSVVIGSDFWTQNGAYFSTGIGFAWSTTYASFTDSATTGDHGFHVHYA
jgi:hypothetical protein